jgi:hypothetical protein
MHVDLSSMDDSCWANDTQNNCNLRHVGTSGRTMDMGMARSEDRISTRQGDLCISIRSMNSLSFDKSEMVSLKNATWISPR